MKHTKFVKEITALIVVAIAILHSINIIVDYRIGMSTLLEDKSKQYNDVALYIRNSMEKYNNMTWLFNYWKEHYEEMDIQYDDKFFGYRKHEEFYNKFPVEDIHTISEYTLSTLPDEAQKLYAEAEYMDWVEKFDDFKKFYHPTFLSCACLTDDGVSRFYFLSGADEGQKRGHGKNDVYVLGSIFENTSSSHSLWDISWETGVPQSRFKDIGSGYYHIYMPYVSDGKSICVIDVTVKIDYAKKVMLKELISMEIVSVIVFVICIFLLLILIKIHKEDKDRLLEQKLEETKELTSQIMSAFVATVEAKDPYTGGHSQRVAKYSVMLAQKLLKKKDECYQIHCAALLHDVGKIGIPEEIINSTSNLTDDQFAKIKTHPEIGHNILSEITKLPFISLGAKYHHERYDGKGYPNNLKDSDIPEIARIIAVADAYDAMTSSRRYRPAMTQEKVREEILKGKGTQFDPVIADLMIELIDEDVYYKLRG